MVNFVLDFYFLAVQTILFVDLRVFLIFLFTRFLIVNLDFQEPLVNFSMGLCLFFLIVCLVA